MPETGELRNEVEAAREELAKVKAERAEEAQTGADEATQAALKLELNDLQKQIEYEKMAKKLQDRAKNQGSSPEQPSPPAQAPDAPETSEE